MTYPSSSSKIKNKMLHMCEQHSQSTLSILKQVLISFDWKEVHTEIKQTWLHPDQEKTPANSIRFLSVTNRRRKLGIANWECFHTGMPEMECHFISFQSEPLDISLLLCRNVTLNNICLRNNSSTASFVQHWGRTNCLLLKFSATIHEHENKTFLDGISSADLRNVKFLYNFNKLQLPSYTVKK